MKITKRLALILVVIMTLSILCACGNSETNARIRENTGALLTGIITDDFALYSSVMAESIPYNDMISAFNQVQLYMDGATEFTLTQVGWEANYSDGVGSYTVTYLVKTDVGDFYINSMELSDAVGISAFGISRAEDSVLSSAVFSGASLIVLVVALVLSIAMLGLMIWMIVDCARRNIHHKALWMVVIILFPAGMLIYLFLRKRLTVMPVQSATAAVRVPDPYVRIDRADRR